MLADSGHWPGGIGVYLASNWAAPFGIALVMVTDRGLAGLAFNDPGQERESFEDMAGRWPNANYVEDSAATAGYAARIFEADPPATPAATDLAFTAARPYGSVAEPTYSGALSFLRRPYTKDLAGADVAVVGVPFDLATTNRPGARLGPRAIRAACRRWCARSAPRPGCRTAP